MRYALFPHEGKWDEGGVSRLSAAWYEPLKMVVHKGEKSLARSFIDIGDSGYELTCVRRTENGIELRLFNAEGNADMYELRVGSQHIPVSIPRFGIKTIQLKSF